MLVCAFLCAICTRDRGCSVHPAFAAPSSREDRAKLRVLRAARRLKHVCNGVIARSESDEAIHASVMLCYGLLRFARNDGEGVGMMTKPASHRQIAPQRRKKEYRDVDCKAEAPQDRAQRRAIAEIGED